MHGVGKVNVAPHDALPQFPSHYVPCRQHLTAMFVRTTGRTSPTSCKSFEPSSATAAYQHKVVEYPWWRCSGSRWADVHHVKSCAQPPFTHAEKRGLDERA